MTVEVEGFLLEHVGVEVDFHHPKGRDLKVSAKTEELYGMEKEVAAIFVRSRDGERFSPDDMLKVFLSRSEAPLAEFVVEGTPGRGKAVARAVFPMTFPEGMMHMETEEGDVDVKTLKIAVTMQPAQGAVQGGPPEERG